MNAQETRTLGRALWRLVRFARPHARRILLGLAANAGARFFDLLPMIVVGRVVDTVSVALRDGQALAGTDFLWAGLLVLGTFAGLAVFQSVSDYTLDSAAQMIRHDLRVELYTHVQRLDVSYFESRQTGDIMAVLAGDVDNLERFFSDTSTSIVRLFITFTGIYGILFWLDWHLALLLLAPMPIAVWAVRFFATRVSPQYRTARKAVGEINSILENNLQGMHVIQAYSAQDHQTGRIRQRSEEYRDAAVRAALERSRFVPLLYGVAGMGYALLIGMGGWMTFSGIGPSVGDFTTFVLLAMRLILPLFVFGMLINQIQQSEASAQRITEIFDTAPTVRDEASAAPLQGALERVEVRNMCFAYPGRDKVLCGIDLTLERGRVLGVVGPTGAGKSSLAKLMLRYYDPMGGEILVNGRPLASVPLDSWRGRIGYVSQEAYLFHGTVGENIRLGSPSAVDDDVRRAARLAGAAEFIDALPDGYDTLVGDRGMKLSGGQRQRISLARAILRDPEFLILDEATASVDTRTEEIIQNNLKELRGDRITLAIAHRLSTVRQCDEIVVIVDGVIVERGTHAELVGAGGVYAGLWQVQSGE
ncbi:ABC transporter ATP-binding protein [Desulfomicrobium escambiense]|uniref:ABC transporter ATP-binding protein n=1 Tax=Desulfomicrobium escambiense TaxID=29503 RepID=UPI00048B98E8|nr:ABC transporter ATP-binding protein [Desulfomicrobium escambiense]